MIPFSKTTLFLEYKCRSQVGYIISLENVTMLYSRKEELRFRNKYMLAVSGMAEKHAHTETFTLGEYAREQKRAHRLLLEEQQQGQLLEGLEQRLADMDDEDCHSDDDSDWEFDDLDDYYFLRPVPIHVARTGVTGIMDLTVCLKMTHLFHTPKMTLYLSKAKLCVLLKRFTN